MQHQQSYGCNWGRRNLPDGESDSSEDTGNAEIEEDDTSDMDSDKEFLVFYDAQIS